MFKGLPVDIINKPIEFHYKHLSNENPFLNSFVTSGRAHGREQTESHCSTSNEYVSSLNDEVRSQVPSQGREVPS